MKNNQPRNKIKENQVKEENKPSLMKEIDIAFIGMACRFPGAMNYEEFWENLKQGRSSIQEIPLERWDWKTYWGDPTEKNKSNSYWGGFIDDVDLFDLSFFGLSATEVEAMDPQQRIMLELTWECFEDAGICPSDYSGKKVGVFIGVTNLDYKELHERELYPIQAYSATGIAPPMIPNRISYWYNFKGPSFSIDTACTCSLDAIHLARLFLEQGECDMALAGGINLILTPRRNIAFSQMGLLSRTGSVKTFDDEADGTLRGEGAGLILLKPLEKAMKDGDIIYGILKGSAVNHTGKTISLTHPNPEAQAEVIINAYKKAEISSESISYIETHGTGTPKGDPIEFQGLLKAFQYFSPQEDQKFKTPFCGLGSVKTNIGHLESAAGIASVIKVLLSMKYKQLPGLVNFKRLNHRISILSSPFYIIDQLQEWKPLKRGNNQNVPRRAGVSSFGAGGTNAHLVIEESHIKPKPFNKKKPYYFICLSAKTEETLHQKEQDLALWLEKEGREDALFDISATLILCREHFEVRSAFVVRDLYELERKLNEVLEKGHAEGYFNENNKGKQLQPLSELPILNEFHVGEEINEQEYCNKLIALVKLYVKGYKIDWGKIYRNVKYCRLNLPVYPFARKRYWIPYINTGPNNVNFIATSFIHPLLHQNTSSFYEYKFSSTFTGREFFLNDHIVKGQKILPGVAYLEMVRMAIEKAAELSHDGPTRILLKNIVWVKPIVIQDQPVQIHVELFPRDNGEIAYEIYSGKSKEFNTDLILHCQGTIILSSALEVQTLDLNVLQLTCAQGRIKSIQCYEIINKVGLNLGPGFQGIDEVNIGSEQVLAKLSLPLAVSDTEDKYILHPSLMDSAIQATVLSLILGYNNKISSNSITSYKLSLPFALQELEILDKCTFKMWAFGRYSESSKAGDKVPKLDIDLFDETGKICVRMKGLSFRTLEGKVGSVKFSETHGTLMLHPVWSEQAVNQGGIASVYDQYLVMICVPNTSKIGGLEFIKESIETRMNGIAHECRCIIMQSSQEDIAEQFQIYAAKGFKEIQSIIKDKPRGKVLIQTVVFGQNEQQLFSGLSGLLKTAGLENSKLIGQLIEMEPDEELPEITKKLMENSRSPVDNRIRYRNSKRYIASWSEVEASQTMNIPWKEKGIYLITGGAGGLGFIFAREIVQQTKDVTLILIGRSPLGEAKQIHLGELRTLGARIEYKQVDVTQKKTVTDLIQNIQEDFGSLNGIIHAAGVIRDNLIINKTEEEFLEVLAPKVTGLVNLDEASKDLPLDFFIIFSSIAGSLGNLGQADYATGNAFMDAYTGYRNSLISTNQRHGKTLSLNWPLWKEGGIQVNEDVEKMMQQTMGLNAIQTLTGINLLYQSLGFGKDQIMVVEGQIEQIKQQLKLMDDLTNSHREKFYKVNQVAVASNNLKPITEENWIQELQWKLLYGDRQDVIEQMQQFIKKKIQIILGITTDEINPDDDLDQYGLDSLSRIRLANDLRRVIDLIIPSELFFEQNTVRQISESITERIITSAGTAYSDQLGTSERDKQAFGSMEIKMKRKIKKLEPLKVNPDVMVIPEGSSLQTAKILITGTTGVLGSRLVEDYLDMTNSTLFCLVRAKNVIEGKERIRKIFQIYNSNHKLLEQFEKRVIPVIGDITQPALGIGKNLYHELTGTIDMVVHTAAKKSLHGLYNEVQAENVSGTKHIIDFTLQTTQKFLVHTSTYTVMGNRQFNSCMPFKETNFDLGQEFKNMGYQRSKFEGEKLVRHAGSNGLKWMIIRPGNIMGDSQNGAYPLADIRVPDLFYDLFKTMIELGCIMNSLGYFDITPVDYVSKGIVYLSTVFKGIYQTYHLLNPDLKTFNEIVSMINKLGYSVDILDYQQFFDKLEHLAYRSLTTELTFFNPTFTSNSGSSYATTDFTRNILQHGKIDCPRITLNLIKTYLDYCIRIGYL